MIQGTTPTFLFKFSVNLDLIFDWRICFAQEGKENLIKTAQDCIIDENNVIYVKLSQEETLAFDEKKILKIQVKALTKDNNVIPSQIVKNYVCEILDKAVFDVDTNAPTKIDTSTIDFEFETEPCGFGLDFEDLYIEKVGTGGGGGELPIDDKFSLVSTNALQNKVITAKIQEIEQSLKDGVSIQSVEQTTTSTEDNGINVITVTLTNGTKTAFEVRNGSKGSQGAKGDKGDKGDKGEQGEQGVQGIQGEKGADGKDGANGKDGVNGKDGADGKDYVLTETDKTDIANLVIGLLPNGDEVSY